MCVILEQNGYGLTEIVQFESTDVMTAEKDMAFIGVVKPHN